MSISDVLTLIGDLAALAAAYFAFRALGKANESISESKALREATQAAAIEATAADRLAAADRQAATAAARAERLEAEHQRLAHRVERAGEIVEELFWKANSDRQPTGPGGTSWMAPRNRLRQAIVGLRDRLPQCAVLVDTAASPQDAFAYASAARNEVEVELKHLHGELQRPS